MVMQSDVKPQNSIWRLNRQKGCFLRKDAPEETCKVMHSPYRLSVTTSAAGETACLSAISEIVNELRPPVD